tara:strand:- start:581 stop:1831 length:1251 start_codon:yes stop_codon:yes gene_type:complete
MTLAERRLSSEVVLALGKHEKRVHETSLADKKVAEKYSRISMEKMVSAEKFHISNDLLELIVEQSFKDQELCLQAMMCGQPPYPLMWIEWDEDYRLNCERKVWESEPFNGDYPDKKELTKYMSTNEFGKQGCLITNTANEPISHSAITSNNFYFFDTLHFADKKLYINAFSPLVEFDFSEERNLNISDERKRVYENANIRWGSQDKIHTEDIRLQVGLRSLGYSWVEWWTNHYKSSRKSGYIVPIVDRINVASHTFAPMVANLDFYKYYSADDQGFMNVKKARDMIGFFGQNEGDLRFLFHALACLNSPEVQREYVKPKPNKKYTKYGVKVPCSEYKSLKLIVPKKRIVYLESASKGHGSPKRFHKRRGHWRNYKNGKMVWIKHCSVGNEELGSIHTEYNLETSHNEVDDENKKGV